MDDGHHIGLFNYSAFQARPDDRGHQLGDVVLGRDNAARTDSPAQAQLLQHGRIVGKSQDVGVGPEPGEFERRPSGAGHHHRFCAEGTDQPRRRGGDGLGAVPGTQVAEIGIDRFGLIDGGIGHLEGFKGVLAHRRLIGEHDGVATVKNGVGHVGDLCPGGHRGDHHGPEHLGGDDRDLTRFVGLGHQLLLYDGHPLHRDLHAQVSPGHHDAVDLGEDGVDVVDTLAPLQLGHDQRLAAGGVQVLPGVEDVFGGAHE